MLPAFTTELEICWREAERLVVLQFIPALLMDWKLEVGTVLRPVMAVLRSLMWSLNHLNLFVPAGLGKCI